MYFCQKVIRSGMQYPEAVFEGREDLYLFFPIFTFLLAGVGAVIFDNEVTNTATR